MKNIPLMAMGTRHFLELPKKILAHENNKMACRNELAIVIQQCWPKNIYAKHKNVCLIYKNFVYHKYMVVVGYRCRFYHDIGLSYPDRQKPPK